jgi:catechol 2,3-dioxygenase-like lactoylglutathione lyase family enzyme
MVEHRSEVLIGPALNLVVLRVSDLEQASRFYGALGLPLRPERHGSGPEHLTADLGGAVFDLCPRSGGAPTAGTRVGFRVSSVEAAVAACRALGAEILSPAAEGPWGLRAIVADPDGHRVELTQAGGAA